MGALLSVPPPPRETGERLMRASLFTQSAGHTHTSWNTPPYTYTLLIQRPPTPPNIRASLALDLVEAPKENGIEPWPQELAPAGHGISSGGHPASPARRVSDGAARTPASGQHVRTCGPRKPHAGKRGPRWAAPHARTRHQKPLPPTEPGRPGPGAGPLVHGNLPGLFNVEDAVVLCVPVDLERLLARLRAEAHVALERAFPVLALRSAASPAAAVHVGFEILHAPQFPPQAVLGSAQTSTGARRAAARGGRRCPAYLFGELLGCVLRRLRLAPHPLAVCGGFASPPTPCARAAEKMARAMHEQRHEPRAMPRGAGNNRLGNRPRPAVARLSAERMAQIRAEAAAREASARRSAA